MARLLEDFAAARPAEVTRRGGDTFIAIEVAPELIEEASRRGIKVLGLEGFLVGPDVVYPALSRIADFSADSIPESIARARALLGGPWAAPPRPADQMHSGASGRHMVVVVLGE